MTPAANMRAVTEMIAKRLGQMALLFAIASQKSEAGTSIRATIAQVEFRNNGRQGPPFTCTVLFGMNQTDTDRSAIGLARAAPPMPIHGIMTNAKNVAMTPLQTYGYQSGELED